MTNPTIPQETIEAALVAYNSAKEKSYLMQEFALAGIGPYSEEIRKQKARKMFCLEAALTAAIEQGGVAVKTQVKNLVPEGWVMVPVEPTEAMIVAWATAKPLGGDYTDENCGKAGWSAMLAAVPKEKEEEMKSESR